MPSSAGPGLWVQKKTTSDVQLGGRWGECCPMVLCTSGSLLLPSPTGTRTRRHVSLAQLSEAAEAFILPKSSSQHCGCMTPRAAPGWGGQAARGASALSQARGREAAAPSGHHLHWCQVLGLCPPLLCYLQHPEVGLVPAQSWRAQGRGASVLRCSGQAFCTCNALNSKR